MFDKLKSYGPHTHLGEAVKRALILASVIVILFGVPLSLWNRHENKIIERGSIAQALAKEAFDIAWEEWTRGKPISDGWYRAEGKSSLRLYERPTSMNKGPARLAVFQHGNFSKDQPDPFFNLVPVGQTAPFYRAVKIKNGMKKE